MRMVLLSLAAALAASTPALADEARVEIHTGLGWTDGQSVNATVGAAAGYDMSLSSGAFAGGEVSVDKVLASDNDTRLGLAGRLGLKVGESNKLYALAGYSFQSSNDATQVGAGIEHSMGSYYTKLEYRHYVSTGAAPDGNALVAGVGLKF